MTFYAAEQFDPNEEDILRRYFTNLDQPVFALVNLPEVVKGALFARYSRSPKDAYSSMNLSVNLTFQVMRLLTRQLV